MSKATETYGEQKKRVRATAVFWNKDGFTIAEMAEELGMNTSFAQQILGDLVGTGELSCQKVTRDNKHGTQNLYKKQAMSARKFIATSYRRHSNFACGIPAEGYYPWAVV